jgi:hypothetical protein
MVLMGVETIPPPTNALLVWLHPYSTLEVFIVEGHHLKDRDLVGQNDAYVEIYLDKKYKQRFQIQIIQHGMNVSHLIFRKVMIQFILMFMCHKF